MNTIILKWNPTSSAYSMINYLHDVAVLNQGHPLRRNWRVVNPDNMQKGDRFFWLKLGLGQVGIAGCGTICSDPYENLDWSTKDTSAYYVDIQPEVLLCPEAVELLPTDILEREIPDFDWRGGDPGVLLNRYQAKQLVALWKDFYNSNINNWKQIRRDKRFPDSVYLAPKRISSIPKKKNTEATDNTK